MAASSNRQYSRVYRTPFAPVSYADVVAALKLPESVPIPDEETPGIDNTEDLEALIDAATEAVEGYIGASVFPERWTQTQDRPERRVWLYKTPVRSVQAVTYLPTWESDTALTLASTIYVLSGSQLVFRDAGGIPETRDAGGFTVTYTRGLYTFTLVDEDDPTDEEITAARALVSDKLKRAILQLIGHLYDNPEGRPVDTQTQDNESKNSALPANVIALLSSSRNWSLTGRAKGTWGN